MLPVVSEKWIRDKGTIVCQLEARYDSAVVGAILCVSTTRTSDY